ncbi:MAG: hypothetical protein BWK73_05200 [Thiothrix lacustris]|uniref:Uncharacterized protein n=1 Tax=Thiothrix lacustris TaxID=525917 RepID=A0A1Y1QXH6_9GAMM|nr:MAG: hypothetical protein BWK73_05200 [Thiothrix lacustris]
MFKVYINGSFDSTHETLSNACRYARTQAILDQHAYVTVFAAGKSTKPGLDTEKAMMKGVPAYIITPHARAITAQCEEQRSAGIGNLVAAAARHAAGMSRGF